MNRVKVKTREQVKSVKALDRAAVAGVRMKNAYVRTKEKAVRNREDRNNTPTGYAGERVQEYARRMARNAVRTVRFGGKAIKQKGRVIFQRYRNSRDGTPPAEHDFTSPKGVTYKEVPFGEDAPLSSRQNPAAQRQQYRRYFYRLKKPLPQERLEEPEVSSYAPTPNLITKRGREFAKKQAAKRRVDMREIKTKEQISFIQKEKPTPDFLPTTSHKMLPKTALQDKEASPALPSRKLLVQKKRTVRTVSPTNTPRPMVKGLRHEVKAVPQAARRAAKAGQKAARLAARSDRKSVV